jgi:hypothetical protein
VASYQENDRVTEHTVSACYPPVFDTYIANTESWAIEVGGYTQNIYNNSYGDAENDLSTWSATTPPLPPWLYAQASQPSYFLLSSDCDQPNAQSYASTTVASTLLQLATGGLATGGNRLVRLVMSATDVYGNPLAPNTFHLQGLTFTPTATNANYGELLMVVPNDSTNTIVPTVNGQSQYNFIVQANDVTLNLFANGNDLSTNTPEFCVGQATTNQAVFNLPVTNGTKVTYQWVASLDFVNLITPPATNVASTSYSLDISVLTNSTAPIWWCTGGYKYIFCKATVQLPNGQTAVIQGEGNVAVDSPVISDFEDEPPSWVTNATVDSTYSLALGDGNSHGDMNYKVSVLSTNAGQIGIVQLINRSASNGSFGSGSLSTAGQFWLDGSYPYLTSGVTLHGESAISFADNPYIANIASGLALTTSCTDQFRDYVVFRPTVGGVNNNIWVTLGVVSGGNPSWGWSGSTTWHVTSWSTPTGSITRPTIPNNSDAFPIWPNTYQ